METHQKKNFLMNFQSISSIKLKKNRLKKFASLKIKNGNFGIKSQLNWFNKNIKKK